MRTLIKLVALFACIWAAPAYAAPTRAATVHGTPLGRTYVASLYTGRTWYWAHGRAFFAADGRFKAWSLSNGVQTNAVGTWRVRRDSAMCFTATWRTGGAHVRGARIAPSTTCFGHRVEKGAILQRKEPNGKWYFFKHQVTRAGDEILKFGGGDRTRFVVRQAGRAPKTSGSQVHPQGVHGIARRAKI